MPGGHHGEDDGRAAAARLAPLEEQEEFKKSQQSDGNQSKIDDTIRVGNSNVKMPEHLVEDERDAASTFRLDAAVIFILAAMLAFIAFVAWQISGMPVKQ
jgi:actin-related protein